MSIRVNLLEDVGQETAAPRRTELFLAGSAIAATAGVIWYLYSAQTMQAGVLTTDLARLKSELETTRKQNEAIVKLVKDKADLEKKIQVVQRLTSPQRRAASVRILDDLSINTPEFLWLTEFSEKSGSATINGRAIDNQTVASFAHNLAKSPYFEKIEIRETVQEEAKGGQTGAPSSLTRFLIESGVNYYRGALESVDSGKKAQKRKGRSKKTPAGAMANLPQGTVGNLPDSSAMERFGTEEMTEEKAAKLQGFLEDAGMAVDEPDE